MAKLAEAFIELRSDASGLRSEARSQVIAALTGVEGRVDLIPDPSGFRSHVQQIARQATAQVKVAVQAVDVGLRNDVAASARKAASGVTADVDVTADGTGLRGEVTREVIGAEAGQEITIPVRLREDASGRLRDARGRFVSRGGGGGGDDGGSAASAGADGEGLERLAKGALGGAAAMKALRVALAGVKLGAVASGASLATGSIAALTGGVVGLTGALAPASGTLVALPALLSAAAQGFGSVLLATSGVGEALKAMAKEEENAVQNTEQRAEIQRMAALAQEAAAERVRSAVLALGNVEESSIERARAANEALGRARQSAADGAESATRRLESADRSLVSTQRNAEKAQQDLTEARRDEEQQLLSLRERVDDYALSEEGAALRIQEAKQRAADLRADPDATTLDRRGADLAIREAEEAYRDLQEERARDTAALAEANAKGIEGSDRVVAARERVADTDQAVLDAVREQADARRDADRQAQEGAAAITAALEEQRDAAEDGRDAVAEAARDVSLALRDQQRAAEDAARKAVEGASEVEEAFKHLSPEAESFARKLYELPPALDGLKGPAGDQLFPALETSLGNLTGLLPTFNTIARDTGGAVGDLTVKFSELVSSGPFAADLATLGERNVGLIEDLGQGFLGLTSALKDVLIEAEPLTDFIGRSAVKLGDWASEAAAAGREGGELRGFFEKTVEVLEQLVRIGGNAGGALKSIGEAGAPLGRELLDTLERLTGQADDFLASVEGKTALADFFANAEPVLRQIGGLIGDVATGLFTLSQDSNTAALIGQIRDELLPAILQLAGATNAAFAPALITAASELLTLLSTLFASGGSLTTLVTAFGDLVGFLNVAIALIPGGERLVGIVLGVASGLTAVKLVGRLSNLVGLSGLIDAIGSSASGTSGKLVGLSDHLKGLGPGLVVGLASVADQIDQMIDDLFNRPVDTGKFTTALTSVGTEAELSKDLVKNLGFSLDELTSRIADVQTRGWLEDFVKGSTKADQAIKDLDAGLVQLVQGGATDAARQQFGFIEDELRGLGLTTEQIERAFPGYTRAIEDAGAAAALAGASHKDMGDKGKTAADQMKDLADQVVRLHNELTSGIRSEISYQESVDQLSAALADNGLTFDANTEAGRENLTAALDLGEEIASLAQRYIEEGSSVDQARTKTREHIGALADQLTQAGLNKEQIQGLLDTIGLTPGEVATLFRLPNLPTSDLAVKDYTTVVHGVPGERNTRFTVDVGQVRDGIPGARSAGEALGSAIGQGIAAGLVASDTHLQVVGSSSISKVLDGMRARAAVASPSRLFASEVGVPISEGVAVGIQQGARAAVFQAQAMLTAVVGDVRARVRGIDFGAPVGAPGSPAFRQLPFSDGAPPGGFNPFMWATGSRQAANAAAAAAAAVASNLPSGGGNVVANAARVAAEAATAAGGGQVDPGRALSLANVDVADAQVEAAQRMTVAVHALVDAIRHLQAVGVGAQSVRIEGGLNLHGVREPASVLSNPAALLDTINGNF